ncbi:MAG: InlB B-repeat-containing protein [Flavobacteriales bacterium]|nr:InlB B-repeat-containing protein [Flavobacteriales bacterium]
MRKLSISYVLLTFILFIGFVKVSAQSNNCTTSATYQLSVGGSCSTTNFNVASTFTAYNAVGTSCIASGSLYRDGWFWFTPSSTGSVTVEVANSNRDMGFIVYSGSCASMTEVACANSVAGQSTESATFTANSGTNYLIRIVRVNNAGNNNMNGTVCVYTSGGGGSDGSTCPNAVTLTPGTQQCGINNNSGSFNDTYGNSPSNPCDSYYNDGEYWFTFTGTGDALALDVSSLSATYSGLFVLDACPTSSPTCIASYTSGSSSSDFTLITPNLTNGTTYYIVLANWSSPYSTNFCLDATIVTPPSNDLCANPTNLPCGTNNLAGTTIGSTSNADPSGCASNYGVWYKFSGNGQQTTISCDAASGYNHELVLFSGSSCGGLTNIACVNDVGQGGVENYTFITSSGVDYYLYVAQQGVANTSTGNFTISRTCATVHTVTFDSNGGSGSMSPQSATSSTPLTTNSFTQSGCYFVEWNTAADGSGTTYANGANYSFSSDITLYAQWNCGAGCLHTISLYDSYGDSWNGGSIDVLVNGVVVLNNITLASGGGPGTHTFPANTGDLIEIEFTAGTYPGENYFDLYDGYGYQILDNYYPNTSGDYSGLGNCDQIPPPSNNTCAGATAFPSIPYGGNCANLLNQTTAYATASGVTPTGACTSNTGTPDDDVWFSFVATESTLYLEADWVSGTSNINFQVFDASCASSMNTVFCFTSDAGGTMTGLTVGNTYYIRMYTNGSGVAATVQDLCIHGDPPPTPGQDCELPLLLCNSNMSVGNPGYSSTGTYYDFDGANDCTGGEKNSMWLQINIASTGDLNFTIMPNDGSNNSNGAETDYDFLLWRMSGTGATTDCDGITANSSTGLLACNFSGDGVTGVAPSGNAPSPINSYFNGAYEPTVSVTAGDVLYLCIQNYSGSTQGFNLDFTNSGIGVVDYTPPTTIFWTAGNSTNDWTDEVNWGNCSVTPICGVDAIVTGSVTNQPSVLTGETMYVENLTINPLATLTMANNATLHVCGDFTNYGNIVFGNNSTIIFDGGSNDQYIYGNCTGVNDFGNFIIDKTGGEVILGCDIEIHRDFTTTNATSVLNTSGFNVTIGRHFSNFDGNNTYSGSGTTGTLTFDGTFAVDQNYDEGASQLDLNHVVIANTVGQHINLLTDMNIKPNSGTLTLTTGQIITNGFEVYVQNDAPTAVTGQNTNSFVRGNLRRDIQALGAYEFPVGHVTKIYQNAKVEFVQATSINNLLARFDLYPGVIPTQGGTECSTTYNLPSEDNGYWTITADANSSTGKYDITLYPTNATNTSGASGWTVTKKADISTGTWGLNGVCAASSTASVVLRYDLQGFSVFGVAQATVPLPLELVSFTGQIENTVNHLYWSTASEQNVDRFELFRSENGYDFYKIGEAYSDGNTTSMRYYDLIDENPANVEYYRLTIIDKNGSIEYSQVVKLTRNEAYSDFNIVPNPSNGLFDLSFSASGEDVIKVNIYDYTGRIVKMQSINASKGNNMMNFDLTNFATGIYSVIIYNDSDEMLKHIKLVKN